MSWSRMIWNLLTRARGLAMGVARVLPILGVAFLVACGGETKRLPNVVLVIGDTLRADALSFQGGMPGATPYVEKIAAQGVQFTQARSHAPWTLPSTASLLSSLHPLEHGAGGQVPRFKKMDESVTTITRTFKDAGYKTHAIVNVTFLDPRALGVTRDFDTVDNRSFESNLETRIARDTTAAALQWMEENASDGPFFLLVHYFDPHCVYAPPKVFRERWAAEPDKATDWTFGTREQMIAIRQGALVPDAETIARAYALYRGEVAYFDAEVGRLEAGLMAHSAEGDTIFALTSDHGEEFMDHAGFEHGHSLFDELVRVPLILRAPGRLTPGVIDAPVRHIDVAPTLAELCNLPVPAQFVGRSLVGLANGESEDVPRGTLAHGNFWGAPLDSWTKGGWKLIRKGDGSLMLFDLREDPKELVDLSSTKEERVKSMLAEMETVTKGMEALNRGTSASLDAATKSRLEALGYGPGEGRRPESAEDGEK